MPGRARQHHVPRDQGDVAAQVREQVVDPPDHLAHRPFLHHLPVEEGAQRRAPYVRSPHDAGADRAEPVHPLDPQHGAGVGAAEVVRAHVVGGREAGQAIPDLGRGDVLHRAAHDGGDLPLVVQPVAVGRPHQRPAVRVERAHRLLEPGRGLAFEGSAELDRARAVVQVHAEDLARLAGRQVDRVPLRHPAAVGQRQRIALRLAPLRPAVEEDPAMLAPRPVEHAHRALPAGRAESPVAGRASPTGCTEPPVTVKAIECT